MCDNGTFRMDSRFMLFLIVCAARIWHMHAQQTCTKWLESIDTPYLSAHNAYHLRQTYSMQIAEGKLANVTTPRWAYTNPSLSELLSNGVLGIELDVNPPDSVSGSNDLPIYHWKSIDETSTCKTLRACLTEINDWLSLHKSSMAAPLLLYIDIKEPEYFSEADMLLINSIWSDIFDEADLYSPATHTNNDVTSPYPDWSQVCLSDVQQRIIPVINQEFMDKIEQDELAPNMFLLCQCQTDASNCIVLRDRCEDERLSINATNRLKYVYREYEALTQSYVQWAAYPLVYNESASYGAHLLGFQVDDALIAELHAEFPQYVDDVKNPLTVDEWQFWQTAVFIDSVGNGDGIWDRSDFVNYLQILSPSQSMLDFTIAVLFWKEGYAGWSTLDPMLWAKLQCTWNEEYGLKDMVVAVNLSQTLIAICEKIEKKYHYLFTDYAYNFSYFQDFTMREVYLKNMCANITVTKHIQQSKVSAGCVSASELESTIYGILAGIVIGSLLLIVIVVVIVYWFVCRKKGGCRVWCQAHCCECCCRCRCCDGKRNAEHAEDADAGNAHSEERVELVA